MLGKVFIFVVLLGMAALTLGCGKNEPNPTAPTQRSSVAASNSNPIPNELIFADMTPTSGIAFTFRNGEDADEYTMLETLGGGVGLIDYDRDGRLDIFVTGGGQLKNKTVTGLRNALFRNEGNWKFQDVTTAVGLDQALMYSHGCAVGDYNNDGWPDLLVTGYGRVALYRNNQGKFEEVTRTAGLLDERPLHWSTSAAWADLNGDGFPDLFIAHYVDWSFQNHPRCAGYRQGQPVDTCSPKMFKALQSAMYFNQGDGTFREVTQQVPLKLGKSLGVLVFDANNDGRPDVYVANDTTDNHLYLNLGQGKFEEAAARLGVDCGENGKPDGSMGVDAADYDGSGLLSIFVANFQGEMHALYRNTGQGAFHHVSTRTGITAIGLDYVGFGTGFIDYDRDGTEDIFMSNGHIARYPPPPSTLAQPPVLLRNLRKPGMRSVDVRFQDVTAQGGAFFRSKHRGRGMAFGDLDNDGRVDMVLNPCNEPVTLLRNVLDNGAHWLGIELVGQSKQDVVGAKVTLATGSQPLVKGVKGGGSYLSSSDRRVVFGLGTEAKAGPLTVRWPSGKTQTWKTLPSDRYWRLTEGKANPEAIPHSAAVSN